MLVRKFKIDARTKFSFKNIVHAMQDLGIRLHFTCMPRIQILADLVHVKSVLCGVQAQMFGLQSVKKCVGNVACKSRIIMLIQLLARNHACMQIQWRSQHKFTRAQIGLY